MFGTFEIAFTQKMKPLPEQIDLSSIEFDELFDYGAKRALQSDQERSWKPAFQVKVVPSGSQSAENTAISWRIVSQSAYKMKIKVDFEQALYISFDEPDQIEFDFADKYLFINEDGIMMDPKLSTIKRSLMR